MKKALFSFLLIVLILPLLQAQSADSLLNKSSLPYRNAFKVNTVGLVFSNMALYYERYLNERSTLLIGSSYRWAGGIPGIIPLGTVVLSSDSRGVKGWSGSAEYRYYFDQCDCATTPAGIYIGAYGRYVNYWGDIRINIWDGTDYVDVGFAGDFKEGGLGLQLGYQMIIGKRFNLDFMIAGPRFSHNWAKFNLGSDYGEDIIPLIEEEINRRLEALGADPISIPTSGEVQTNFSYRYFRYGISFGFMF